jgi:hypothetical protein
LDDSVAKGFASLDRIQAGKEMLVPAGAISPCQIALVSYRQRLSKMHP